MMTLSQSSSGKRHWCCVMYPHICAAATAVFAAASESGALRAIKSSTGAAVALEFGAVQTQQAGDAAALRRKFAAAGGSSAGGAS
jgi:hypothetical protein